jgi:hypothetical protein
MSKVGPLTFFYEKSDTNFFADHPDREAHIRKAFQGENEQEFRNLGPHNYDRRRLLLWKVPEDNPYYDPRQRPLVKIPFLAFADETIEDTDAILLPILHEIMCNAVRSYAND